MTIVTKNINYHAENVVCNGMVAYDDASSVTRPLVMVVHDWSGRNAFAEEKAKQLAALGYIGFAIDMYGGGRCGETNDEKTALMQPLRQDRKLLLTRIQSAYHAVTQLPYVDSSRIGAIGFCFGGLCALDLARSGLAFAGAVSFHGLLIRDENIPINEIKAKVLVLHGYDDPMVPKESVLSFADEMTQAKADWQIHMYSNTVHGFMNPAAHDAKFGTVYNARTSERAWQSMQSFFDEIFSSR